MEVFAKFDLLLSPMSFLQCGHVRLDGGKSVINILLHCSVW